MRPLNNLFIIDKLLINIILAFLLNVNVSEGLFSFKNIPIFSCKKSFCLILLNTDAIQDKKEDYARKDQLNEFKDQNDPNGLGAFMDENAKLKIGKMKGPKFHLFGEIVSISSSNSDGKDVYYKMTLSLLNLEEGLLDWSEEKELRKIKEKKLFGF